MTLIELLVTLAILVGVLGMSIAVYSKLASSGNLPAATSHVSSIIRAARNFSVSAGLPSRIFLEPGEAQRVTAFGFKQVASWHFEDAPGDGAAPIPEGTPLRGAFREDGLVFGEIFTVRGRIGKGLYFGPQGIGSSVSAEHRPRYYSPLGFSMEAWVLFEQPPLTESMLKRRQRTKGAWVDPRRQDRFAVISKSGSYEMGILGDAGLYLSFGEEGSEAEFVVEIDGRAVVPGRWAHLRCTFDGLDITMEIDGMRRAWYPAGFAQIDPRDWPPLPEIVPPGNGDLNISHPKRIFIGVIDEPKVRIALEPRSYELPGGITFWGIDEPTTIYFDTRGSLDALHHTEPVVIQLVDASEVPEEPEVVPGTTVVVHAEGEEGEGEVQEEEIGDPLRALAEYLEKKKAASGPSDGSGLAEDEEEVQPPPGPTREIIIDLTGTIRG